MDVWDAVPVALDERDDAGAHLGEASDAEDQGVGWAWRDREQAVEACDPIHDPLEPTERRARRIVGMNGKPYAGRLCRRDDRREEFLEIVPHPLARDGRLV